MFGVQVVGEGSAWIDNISLKSDDAAYSSADETVRALITRFADSRNARDGAAAAATYTEDGEYINTTSPLGVVKGTEALAKLWGSLTGQVQRRIQAVEFLAPNIAAVHVAAESPNDSGAVEQFFDETFIAVRDGSEWRIKVHQAAKFRAAPLTQATAAR
jgi:uncharacterized protein (TIGR02246 family)